MELWGTVWCMITWLQEDLGAWVRDVLGHFDGQQGGDHINCGDSKTNVVSSAWSSATYSISSFSSLLRATFTVLARSRIFLKIFEEEAPPSIIPDEVFAADSKTVEDWVVAPKNWFILIIWTATKQGRGLLLVLVCIRRWSTSVIFRIQNLKTNLHQEHFQNFVLLNLQTIQFLRCYFPCCKSAPRPASSCWQSLQWAPWPCWRTGPRCCRSWPCKPPQYRKQSPTHCTRTDVMIMLSSSHTCLSGDEMEVEI